MWSIRTKNFKIFLARNFHLTESSKCNVVGSIKASEIGEDILLEDRPVKSFEEIPGPSSLPLIGTIHHFLPGGKYYNMDRKVMCDEFYRLYGPIVKINNPDTVFLFDAESFKKIYKSEEPTPIRPRLPLLDMYRQKYNRSFQIGGLVNSNTAEWKKVRSSANKVMLEPKFVYASYTEVLDNIAKEAVARLGSLRDSKNMIPNLTQEIHLFALESSAMISFARRLNCFRSDLPKDSFERRLVSLVQSLFKYIEKFDLRGDRYLNFGLKKALATIAELEIVILHFINNAIKDLESKSDTDVTPTCTIQKMIHLNREHALPLAFDSLLGGESITQTILIFLYCLALNAEKREKLREEILSGNEGKSYLRACLKEASRLMPTFFAIARITTKPYQLLGYEIPKGLEVIMVHRIPSLMESQFPRAHEFIPERWLVEKDHPLSHRNANPYAHGPFGFGSRGCLGRRISYMTMEAFIINLFKEFDVNWDGLPVKVETRTSNVMMPPLHFVFNNLK